MHSNLQKKEVQSCWSQQSWTLNIVLKPDSAVCLVKADWMPGCLGSSCSGRGPATGHLRAFPAENAGRRASQGQIPPRPECTETHTDYFQVSLRLQKNWYSICLSNQSQSRIAAVGLLTDTENTRICLANMTGMGHLVLWVLSVRGGFVFLRDLQFCFLFHLFVIFFFFLLDTSTLLIMLGFFPAWPSPGSLLWPAEHTRKGNCLWMMYGLYQGMSLQMSIVEGRDILFLTIFLFPLFYTLVHRQWYSIALEKQHWYFVLPFSE